MSGGQNSQVQNKQGNVGFEQLWKNELNTRIKYSFQQQQKLQTNSKRKVSRSSNMWKLNHTLLNNQGSKKSSKGKQKFTSKQVNMKIQHFKVCGMQQKQF